MQPTDYLLTFAFGGAFVMGLLFIVMRREAQVNVQSGMSAEGLMQQHSGMGFGKAKKNLDRKLAAVQDILRRQNHSDLGSAEERFAQRREEDRIAEEEARRRREEEDAQREDDEEEERNRRELEMEQKAAQRAAEEARLASERESARQLELANAESDRLEEIGAAREQEALESREAAQRAMSELQARLEREGAQSSDVQVSLMWNNYNDLDLHVVCPSGERIHGGNKNSDCGGELDVDANVRAETRKPVENVFWEEGSAPAGKYQVYVHYYKKHKKRRSKDPTKFQLIVNAGSDLMEFNGDLSLGDPIMLVAEFVLPSLEERAGRRRELEQALLAAGGEIPEEMSEQEEARQAALAAAESQRLEEIEIAKEQEMLESREAAQRAMSELQARLEREGAQSSDVQVSLMWNNYNDLDLHVVCPSGERIHGGNKISGCGGELDVDANVRAETRKPVENVFWQEGSAPAGKYQVYVHYYKKHNKRRSKDPTKFQLIVNAGNDLLEFSGELSTGDPIMLVTEFDVPTPEEREERRLELEKQIQEAKGGIVSEASADDEEKMPEEVEEKAAEEVEEKAAEEVEENVSMESEDESDDEAPSHELPGAPDLDSLMGDDDSED
jgi:uncharacterized protein YfaP (DUF2135 family)